MAKRIDLSGQKFNMLTVIEYSHKSKNNHSMWKCKCDCGNTTVVDSYYLKSGKIKSCGCLKIHDITGQRFGRYTVIRREKILSSGHSLWLCQCDCGNIRLVDGSNLHRHYEISCGCARKEKHIENSKYRGKSKEPLFQIWASMVKRCTNASAQNYKYYGGRGIKVCEDWMDDKNGYFMFRNWALTHGYEDGLSIERIDVNENYCPDNCTWIPLSEQSKNKRNNHYLTFNGETKTITDWSKSTGLARQNIYDRLKRGWSVEKTLTTPVSIKAKK